MSDVTVTIDGTALRVPAGTLLVEAAKQIHKEIPVYCYHPKLGPAGLCRICLVEIEKMPKLQIACNTPVTDGMIVHTQNERVNDGRRAVLEFLLLNHPLDCPICDKGGECDLQDFSMAYGQSASRLADPKVSKPKAVELGPTIVLDEERCIVCQRCVRFDDVITGERALVVKDRGAHDIIATATDEPYRSTYSGNVTELCPVGALTSKTYRFRSRPWDLHRTTTTCTQCSVGCALHVDEREGEVLRTMSVPEDSVSDGWLCDRGRYNVGFFSDGRRLRAPLLREPDGLVQIGWDDALTICARELQAAKKRGTAIGVLGGGRLLNEEIVVLSRLFRRLGTANLDWRSGRQRQANPGARGGSFAELENAQAIVVAGASPAESAPILHLRIRKAVYKNGARLFAFGGSGEPAAVACEHVADANAAFAQIPASAERIAIVWDGADLGVGAELQRGIEALAAHGCTVHVFVAGEQPNARGAELLGMHPRLFAGSNQPGWDTARMLSEAARGSLGALWIAGANPMLHFPDRVLAGQALAATPFVVVSELFLTETAHFASLILPAQASFEKSGTTTNCAGELLPVNAGVEPPEGTRSDFDMLIALAEALGVALPSPAHVHQEIVDRHAAVAPDFGLGAEVFSTECKALSGDGLRVAFEPRIFAGGGTVAHDDRIETLRPLPEAAFSATDAEQLGLETGDFVDLQGDGVLHDLLVEVRPQLPPGVVSVISGLPDAPANILGPKESVSVANVRKTRARAEAAV